MPPIPPPILGPTVPSQTVSPEAIPAALSVSTLAPAPAAELDALLSGVGVSPLDHAGWIRITGSDRVRWLNGMVTNSIGDLTPGTGCYNLLLNAQGRIQGDGDVFAEPGHLLLRTSAAQVPSLLALLDRFIIMDDVELTDITAGRRGLLVAGPHAPSLLRTLNLLPSESSTAPPTASQTEAPAPTLTHVTWQTHRLTLLSTPGPLVPRFELWPDEPSPDSTSSDPAAPEPDSPNPASSDPAVPDLLHRHLLAAGATACTPAAVETLRVLEGTPLFATDIRDRDLPQETGATARALHFSKGCYLGQEIVERIRSRGNVHRTFTGFHLEGAAAAPGTPLLADVKASGVPASVGELTSVVTLTSAGGPLLVALGYIRREALALGQPIHYEGGLATPHPLPFHLPFYPAPADPAAPRKDPPAATDI